MNQKNKKSDNSKERKVQYNAIVTAEILFVLLPFIVIGIISFHKGDVSRIFSIPEWSLASAILVGQTIVKLISGLLAKPREIVWEKVALLLAILIVLVLVPSLIVLTLVMISEEVPLWLILFQVSVFFLSVFLFYKYSSVGGVNMWPL